MKEVYERQPDGSLKKILLSDEQAVTCEYCLLYRIQPTEILDGEYNDEGWWCRECINKGHRRTKAQYEWKFFAQDYPQFALELKRLRKKHDAT